MPNLDQEFVSIGADVPPLAGVLAHAAVRLPPAPSHIEERIAPAVRAHHLVCRALIAASRCPELTFIANAWHFLLVSHAFLLAPLAPSRRPLADTWADSASTADPSHACYDWTVSRS